MSSPIRLLTTSRDASQIGANDETWFLSLPLALVVGCTHCGGVRQTVLRLSTDWTADQVTLYAAYYHESLTQCTCNPDALELARMRQEALDMGRRCTALEVEKAELEHSLARMMDEVRRAMEPQTGEHYAAEGV